jgi:ABC-type uncharacterized transport system permease subunit
MGPAPLKILLMVSLPAFVVGFPLLVGVIVFGMWLRRTNRSLAAKPFLGAALSGAVSFLSMMGAIALLIAIAVQEEHHPDYFEDHPLLPLLMIGLGLLALATAFIAALFAVWTVWRAFGARPLSPDAAAAGTAPTRSAG